MRTKRIRQVTEYATDQTGLSVYLSAHGCRNPQAAQREFVDRGATTFMPHGDRYLVKVVAL